MRPFKFALTFAAIAAATSALAQGSTVAMSAPWAEAVAREGLQSPCLTIVGEVVRLRDELAWFGRQPAGEPVTSDAFAVETCR